MTTPNLFSFVKPYYQNPLVVDHAKDCTVFDASGREFLDAYSGVASVSVGHSNARIISRVKSQIDRVHHTSMLYQTEALREYLRGLQSVLPPTLSRHFFVNSGSEAIDFAFQATRAHSQRKLVVAFSESYHGGSYLTKSLTGLEAWQPIVKTEAHALFFPIASCRTCSETHSNKRTKRLNALQVNCNARCLDALYNEFRERRSSIAGVFLEPVLGVGGILLPMRGFFSRLAELCLEFNINLICDEVQTGFGRVGSTLFAFERFGLQPDLVCFGKGIANGFPMGLVSGTEEISESMASKLHFSTFGGNPISCAAGLETLKIIQDEKLLDNSEKVGEFLMARLDELLVDQPECLEIRGLGLMIGVELSKNVSTVQVLENCYRRGLLVGIGGRDRNVIRIEPPLIFSIKNAELTAETLFLAIKETQINSP